VISLGSLIHDCLHCMEDTLRLVAQLQEPHEVSEGWKEYQSYSYGQIEDYWFIIHSLEGFSNLLREHSAGNFI